MAGWRAHANVNECLFSERDDGDGNSEMLFELENNAMRCDSRSCVEWHVRTFLCSALSSCQQSIAWHRMT